MKGSDTASQNIRRLWEWLRSCTSPESKETVKHHIYSDGAGQIYATDGYVIHVVRMPASKSKKEGKVTIKDDGVTARLVTENLPESEKSPFRQLLFSVIPPANQPPVASFCLDVDYLRRALEVHGHGRHVQFSVYGHGYPVEIAGPDACAYIMPLGCGRDHMVWRPEPQAQEGNKGEAE